MFIITIMFQASQTLNRQTYLLSHSLFDKFGNLFPGTERDSHLLQVLDCAHELREYKRDKITLDHFLKNLQCYQFTFQI